MFQNLGVTETSEINLLALKTCAHPRRYGELAQLRTLFHPNFTRRLEEILRGSVRAQAGGPRHVDVSLGWIDKIPLARSDKLDSTPPKFERTELGDAVVFAFDNVHGPSGKVLRQEARALLLQAKVTRDPRQLLAPRVPLAPSHQDSTRKEYALLSTWPEFDLYKSSGSKTPLMAGVNLHTGGPQERYGWYIGAPRTEVAPGASPWTSWWMSAPAQRDAPFQSTIGEIFVSFLAAQPLLGLPVGEGFSPGAMSSDWSGLCTTVLDLVDETRAPPSLFAPGQRRLVRVGFEAALFLEQTAPNGVDSELRWGRRPWALYRPQLWPSLWRRVDRRQIEAWRRAGETPPKWWDGFRRRLPVLSVTLTRRSSD